MTSHGRFCAEHQDQRLDDEWEKWEWEYPYCALCGKRRHSWLVKNLSTGEVVAAGNKKRIYAPRTWGPWLAGLLEAVRAEVDPSHYPPATKHKRSIRLSPSSMRLMPMSR